MIVHQYPLNMYKTWIDQINLLDVVQPFSPTTQSFYMNAIETIVLKNKKGIDKINLIQVQLEEKLIELGKSFSRKRLLIENIEGNDSFL